MTDRITTALAETLREHDHDVDGGASPARVIEGARRRRARRRAGTAAGVLGATAATVAVVVLGTPGQRPAAPVPAGSSSAAPTPATTLTSLPDVRGEAYAWAARQSSGGPFDPVTPAVTAGAGSRLTFHDKAGSVTLGAEPMRLQSAMRVGPEDRPSTTFVVGRGSDSTSVWAVREGGPRSASKVWSGAQVLDVLGGPRGFALVEGDAQGSPTRLVTIDLESLGVRSSAFPSDGPRRPRLATWAGGAITVVDGQDLLDPTSVAESPSYSWSPTSGWQPGQRVRWLGAAAPGYEAADPGRNVVLVGSGSETCAHLMVGSSLTPAALACAPRLSAERAPTGSLVLVSRYLDNGDFSSVRPTVVDVADGSVKQLPVGLLPSPLRWETNLTLAGQVPDATGQQSLAFRIDLGKEGRHEQIPGSLPQG